VKRIEGLKQKVGSDLKVQELFEEIPLIIWQGGETIS